MTVDPHDSSTLLLPGKTPRTQCRPCDVGHKGETTTEYQLAEVLCVMVNATNRRPVWVRMNDGGLDQIWVEKQTNKQNPPQWKKGLCDISSYKQRLIDKTLLKCIYFFNVPYHVSKDI